METRGAINAYTMRTSSVGCFTINLAAGTTPFMIVTEDGTELESRLYRLNVHCGAEIVVSRAFFRPIPEEFMNLQPSVQVHILRGGLIHRKLADARQLPNDKVEADWSFDRVSDFMFETYARRPKSLSRK